MRSRLGATSGQVKPLRQIQCHPFPATGNTAAVSPMRADALLLGQGGLRAFPPPEMTPTAQRSRGLRRASSTLPRPQPRSARQHVFPTPPTLAAEQARKAHPPFWQS
jgi:hypothetical protein